MMPKDGCKTTLENLDPHLRGFDGERMRDASWESAWHMKKRFAIFMKKMEDMPFYILHRCFPNSIVASAPTATSAVSENVATCPKYNNTREINNGTIFPRQDLVNGQWELQYSLVVRIG